MRCFVRLRGGGVLSHLLLLLLPPARIAVGGSGGTAGAAARIRSVTAIVVMAALGALGRKAGARALGGRCGCEDASGAVDGGRSRSLSRLRRPAEHEWKRC